MSVPVHAPARVRRSRGRRIAAIIWLVLFVVVLGATVLQVVRYTSQPEDQRVPAAGGTVTITEPGEYSIYAESGSQAGNWGSVSSVTAPSGAPVALQRPSVSENYTNNGVAGVRIATFEATESGAYTVIGAPQGTAPGDRLVIGTRTIGSVLSMVFGAAATGFLLVVGLIGGLVMLLTRRRRDPVVPTGPWGPGAPPAGLGPQPGAAPWSRQPGAAPSSPQAAQWTPQQGGPAPWPAQQYPAPQQQPQSTAGDDATTDYRRTGAGEPGSHG